MSISIDEYKKLSADRQAEAKSLFLAALDGVVPDGYTLSDDPGQMYGNAHLRMKPIRVEQGMYSLCFFHSINYRSAMEGGEYRISPTREFVWISADVYDAPGLLDGFCEFGESGKLTADVLGDDLAAAVRDIVSRAMSQVPFILFEWRVCEHDKETLELYNQGRRIAKIWKSGKQWGTLTGNSFRTQAEARAVAEDCEAGLIAISHQERLAGLAVGRGA